VRVKILLRDWKRQKSIEHMKHRVKFIEVAKDIELGGRPDFTTMEPPKQAELSQTAKKSRFRTRAQIQSQENEQQPPEVLNVDEIPSPDTTRGIPTPIVE
jgi:hypothetical protein